MIVPMRALSSDDDDEGALYWIPPNIYGSKKALTAIASSKAYYELLRKLAPSEKPRAA
jgi:hypothetical protein